MHQSQGYKWGDLLDSFSFHNARSSRLTGGNPNVLLGYGVFILTSFATLAVHYLRSIFLVRITSFFWTGMVEGPPGPHVDDTMMSQCDRKRVFAQKAPSGSRLRVPGSPSGSHRTIGTSADPLPPVPKNFLIFLDPGAAQKGQIKI